MVGSTLAAIGLVLLLALVGHLVIVAAIPHVMMRRQMRIYRARQGTNDLGRARSARADVRTAARRPNADMLLSNAAFDLRQGPLLVSCPVPRDHYWSVSFYATNSDCFFVVNQTQVESDSISILLTTQEPQHSPPQGGRVVTSPSKRGIVVIRQAIPRADMLEDAAALQDRATIRSAAYV